MNKILERFSLEGKKALIICPENPYSREIAQGLKGAGAEIWVAGETTVDLGVDIAGSFTYTHGSIESAANLECEVRAKMGTLDIVIENGLYTPVKGWKQSYAEIYDQLSKTELGLMLTVQSLGHILAEQGHGSVILVADYGALVGYDPVNYKNCPDEKDNDFSFVKGFIYGGVVNYAGQASNYLAENGCRCNAVAFAPLEGNCCEEFKTAFTRHNQVKRLANADDISSAIIFLASDASEFITGITMPVDGGYIAK
ncbi:MAG: SDR family oxidoreductase [Firmicutes bacterium]|nr:SDR family oxidoreductase [Bacillota bacterium]